MKTLTVTLYLLVLDQACWRQQQLDVVPLQLAVAHYCQELHWLQLCHLHRYWLHLYWLPLLDLTWLICSVAAL